MSKINCKSWDSTLRVCRKDLLTSSLASSFCPACPSREPYGLGDVVAAATAAVGIRP